MIENKKQIKIEVGITENDIEMFKDIVYKNQRIKWDYESKTGEIVKIEFISEDEMEQRGK